MGEKEILSVFVYEEERERDQSNQTKIIQKLEVLCGIFKLGSHYTFNSFPALHIQNLAN